MNQYEELKARLRSKVATLRSPRFLTLDDESLKAIESLERQLAERDAEISGWKADQKENIDVAFNLQKQLATVTAQRDLLKDAMEHIATSPKLSGSGWASFAQATLDSLKGE